MEQNLGRWESFSCADLLRPSSPSWGWAGLGGRFDYALDGQQYAVMCSR